MGNAVCAASIPIKVAGGLVLRGLVPTSGSPPGEAVINIPDPTTMYVRVSSETNIDGAASLCVKERDDTTSWVIANPGYVDAARLREDLKFEVAANIFSVQNTNEFAKFLDKIRDKSGIGSAGALTNLLFSAIDTYITPAGIAQYVHSTYSSGTTVPSDDPDEAVIFHTRGTVQSWEIASATSTVQNLNVVLMKNALMTLLSQDATLQYILCELNVEAMYLMHGENSTKTVIWIVFIASLFVGAILIYHSWHVREKYRKLFCPSDLLRYTFSCA